MGTPAPIFSDGLDCGFCWGIGKTFGDGTTPKYITLDIVGNIKSDIWLPIHGDPVNGRFTLEQRDLAPCQFDNRGILDNKSVVFELFVTDVTIRNDIGTVVFRQLNAPLCSKIFDDNGALRFTGGTVTLEIPEDI